MTTTQTVTESSPPRAPAPDELYAPTDAQAVTVVRTGISAQEEFRLFAVEHSPALLRIAYLLCGDPHRAHDLTQTALERTYRHWSAVRGGNPFAYARRVLATARIDGWRRTRREVLLSPEDLGPLHDGGDGSRATAGQYAAVADRQQLVSALRRLGASQRRVIVLRHLLDLSEADTAAELGLSVGTVKSHSARGLARLRQILQEGTDA